jgi:hypothetical protein
MARSKRVAFGLFILLFATAAAPFGAERLGYDPAVYLAGDCLSPALTGCNAARRINVSASQALLEAGSTPQLRLELAGLLDLGPEVTGGSSQASRTLR